MRSGHRRDQDLLLVTHGALSPVRRVLTEWHLRRCSQCRQRRRQLAQVSQSLATAIRGPADPSWHPRAPTGRVLPSGRVLWGGLLVALSFFLILGLMLYFGALHSRHSLPVSPYSGGCRPDLPNARCR